MPSLCFCKEDLFCGVNNPEQADPDAMSDLAKKHVPVMSAPGSVGKGACFEVVVEVGKHKEHPSEPAHFINFVELYAAHTYLGRQHFVHTMGCPVAKFCIRLEQAHKELRAVVPYSALRPRKEKRWSSVG